MGSDFIYQLINKDNWDVAYDCLWVIDRMPLMMRHCTLYKAEGMKVKKIAIRLHISEGSVRKQLSLAKKRIIQSMTCSLIEDIDE